MTAICQLIALFLTFMFGSSLVIIGNYTQLNPKGCGVSRRSSPVANNCFKWNKVFISGLKRGKNVSYGEAPWLALLKYNKMSGNRTRSPKCTGSLFANQWILTAGHCMRGAFNIRIYLGHNLKEKSNSNINHYVSNETYVHEKYRDEASIFDVALVKLDRAVDTSIEVNNICLPDKERYVKSKGVVREYVNVAGWGGPSNVLNIAYWYLRADLSHMSMAMLDKLDGLGACSGDSGSPVWQYQLDRAVIAVVLTAAKIDSTGCNPDDSIQKHSGVWVNEIIDWIKGITHLN